MQSGAVMKRILKTVDIPLTFTTYWTIMPKDTNYMSPLVFGGAMMSQVDFTFTGRSYAGDTIQFVSYVEEVRDNSIRFMVKVFRCPLPDGENKGATEFEQIGEHELVFVTMLGDEFTPHRLKDVIGGYTCQ
jgi:acyl-CoA hydrolase